MNQTNGRELTLSAVEARNLHTEIFELLAQISELSKIPKEQIPTVTNVEFDGGGF